MYEEMVHLMSQTHIVVYLKFLLLIAAGLVTEQNKDQVLLFSLPNLNHFKFQVSRQIKGEQKAFKSHLLNRFCT